VAAGLAAVLLMAVLRLGPDSCGTYTMKLKAGLITVPGGAAPRFDADSCVQKVTIALAVKLLDVLVMAATRKLSLTAVLVVAVLWPGLLLEQKCSQDGIFASGRCT
jgi:hypothetical protein